MSRTIVTILTLATLPLAAACASIMQGTTQEVGISSQPTQAQVTIDNQERGATPMVAELARKNQHTVRIEMDGYEPYEVSLTKSTSGWVWGNIVFGGIIGLAVDAISGGLYKLNPAQVEAELRRSDVAESVRVTEEGVYVFVTLEPKVEWEEMAVLESDGFGLDRRVW